MQIFSDETLFNRISPEGIEIFNERLNQWAAKVASDLQSSVQAHKKDRQFVKEIPLQKIYLIRN